MKSFKLHFTYSTTLLLLLLLLSCIDPFPIPLVSSRGLLVVDGMISNGTGPVTVRLSWAYAIDRNFEMLKGVTNARVEICDESGGCTQLPEVSEGLYQTSDLQGQIGRTYQLKVRTSDEKEYRSTPEQLLPPGTVSSVTYKFDDHQSDGFNVYANGTFSKSDSVSFAKLGWQGTYEVETFPREKIRPYLLLAINEIIWIPNPPPCSGHEFIIKNEDPLDTITAVRGGCKCCTCWVQDVPSIPVLLESSLLTSADFYNTLVAKVPINGRTMHSRYVLKIVNQAISRRAYNFFNAIRSQKLGVADLFQPAIGRLPGNISNPNDPNDRVLGIFYAASASDTVSFSFDRNMVPYQVAPVDSVAEDCSLAYRNSTTTKPHDW